MSNYNVLRFDSRLRQNIELLQRRSAWDTGMGEDRQVGLHMRFADGAEHPPFGFRDLVPTADLAESPHWLGAHYSHQFARHLFLAPGGDFRLVERLRIKSRTRDNRHPRLL